MKYILAEKIPILKSTVPVDVTLFFKCQKLLLKLSLPPDFEIITFAAFLSSNTVHIKSKHISDGLKR